MTGLWSNSLDWISPTSAGTTQFKLHSEGYRTHRRELLLNYCDKLCLIGGFYKKGYNLIIIHIIPSFTNPFNRVVNVRRYIYISILIDGFSIYFSESKQTFTYITSNDISNSLSLTCISLEQLQSDIRALKGNIKANKTTTKTISPFVGFHSPWAILSMFRNPAGTLILVVKPKLCLLLSS